MIDLTLVTVAQFQAQFTRGFPYLPVYNNSQVYNSGNNTYYNSLFYTCNDDAVENVTPGTSPVWTQYSDNVNNYIQDQDITNAFAEAQITFNQGLFGNDTQVLLGYLYLTAHYLVNDLRAAAAGFGAVGAMIVTSRSVGSVSESYDIPQKYKDSPVLQFYTTTMYGMKYLNMVLPYLVGNMAIAQGSSGVPPWQFE